MRSNTIKTVSSPIIHHSLFPHSLSICLSNFSQRACQRNWTRQLSNPPAMSEDGRWSPLFFSHSPNPTFLLSGFKTLVFFSQFFGSFFLYYFVRTKEGEEGASSLLLQVLGSSWLTLLPRSEMTMKGATDPYCAPNGIYIPCLCVIPSHTLHFLSLLTYTDPTSKVKVCTKERKHFFFFWSLFVLSHNDCLFSLKLTENWREH